MYRTVLRSLIVSLAITGAATPGYAQQDIDFIPRELYDERMRPEGNTLTFCINPLGVLADFERDFAQTIGDTLLTDVSFYEIKANDWPSKPLPFDYRIVLGEDQMFIMLAQECDGFMGFLLSASNPTWMTLTRPYLSARTVLVRKDGDAALESLPFGDTIGVRMMAAGDNRLIQYLGAQPEGRTWRRTPYPDNELMLRRLDDGTISAGLIWEYGLFGATDGDPAAAGLSYTYALPFPIDPIEIGIATRAEDGYLNGMLSDAIAALVEDGTVEDLLRQHGLTAASEQ